MPLEIEELAETASLSVLGTALEKCGGDATAAVAAICIAAGQAIAFSRIRLGTLLNIIVSRYEITKELSGAGVTPTEIPEGLRQWKA